MAIQEVKRVSLNQQINDILNTTQGKVYFTTIATIVTVILMFLFAILPAYVSITDQLTIMEKKREYLRLIDIKRNNLNILIQQVQNYEKEITLLELYVNDDINNEYIAASINQIAENNDCKLLEISFSQPATNKNMSTLNIAFQGVKFDFQMYCNLDSFESFYESINKFPIPIIVNAFSYTNKNGSSNKDSRVTSRFDGFYINLSTEYFYWNKPKIIVNNTINE